MFYRVAYCVAVFTLLDPKWFHLIYQLEVLRNNFGNWLNNDISEVSRIQTNTGD
jgi:hypothetical protein